MDSTEQDAIDDIMGDLDTASEAGESASESPDLSAEENTSEGASSQDQDLAEHAESPVKYVIGNPSGKPWRDYIPKDVRPVPRNLEEWLDRAFDDRDYKQKEGEFLCSLQLGEDRPHKSYVEEWVDEVNANFRLAMRLRNRKRAYLKRLELAKEEADRSTSGE